MRVHLSLLLAISSLAAAGSGDRALAARRPPSGDPWLTVRIGALLDSNLALSAPDAAVDVDFGDAQAFDMAFGIGAYYRTSRFDLGVLIDHVGSGKIRPGEQDLPLGSIVRIAAAVRWRFVDASWGSFYLRVSPGVAFLRHSESLRREIAGESNFGFDGEGADDVDEFGTGFSIGFELGAMFYVEEKLGIFVEVGPITTYSSINDGLDDWDLRLVQSVAVAGVDMRL